MLTHLEQYYQDFFVQSYSASLGWSLNITLFLILFAFFYGLFTRNYSTVDRVWSVLPAVFAIFCLFEFSHLAFSNVPFTLSSILIILWATRLTGNFALKGGYKFSFKKGFMEEDYRWPILKEKIPSRFVF